MSELCFFSKEVFDSVYPNKYQEFFVFFSLNNSHKWQFSEFAKF